MSDMENPTDMLTGLLYSVKNAKATMNNRQGATGHNKAGTNWTL